MKKEGFVEELTTLMEAYEEVMFNDYLEQFTAEYGITLSEDMAANIAKLQKNINSLNDKIKTRRSSRQDHIQGRNDPKKVAAFDTDIAKKKTQIAKMQEMIKKMRDKKSADTRKEKGSSQHQQKAA